MNLHLPLAATRDDHILRQCFSPAAIHNLAEAPVAQRLCARRAKESLDELRRLYPLRSRHSDRPAAKRRQYADRYARDSSHASPTSSGQSDSGENQVFNVLDAGAQLASDRGRGAPGQKDIGFGPRSGRRI